MGRIHLQVCRTFIIGPIILTAILAAQANSQTAPPAHPDWTGFYHVASAKELGDLKPISPNLDAVIIAHLQPWARAKMEATDGVADDTGSICQPDGPFRYPTAQATTFLWLSTPAKEFLIFGPQQIVTAGIQRIYMNRTRHPSNLSPTWNGDSIGHWEGDTLVVDTVGFNDKSWLQPGMEPHSEETHMIQRFRRLANGFMEMQTTIEDRLALTSAYVYSRYYKKVGKDAPEDICSDDLQIWKDWRNKALDPLIERSRVVR
jgi:hypothetical protein